MKRMFVVLAIADTLVACGPPPHHYRVDRTALVPVPVPDQAAPMEWEGDGGTAEVTLSHATVLWANEPERSPASNIGLYVPRHQPGLMVRWRPRFLRDEERALAVDLRAGAEAGLLSQAYRVADNGLAPPAGGVAFVYWGGWAFTRRYESGLHWSLSTDLMIADVASNIRMECLDCSASVDPVTEGKVREGIAGVRSQLLAGMRRGPVELAALGALRNHPLNVGTREEEIHDTEEARSTMTTGDMFPVIGALVGVRAPRSFRIAASVFWPIDPKGRTVEYGPIAGASISFQPVVVSKRTKEKAP